MVPEHIQKLALEEAEKSPCGKRKVGAIITDEHGILLSAGHNHGLTADADCEDSEGVTKGTVVHAEIHAIKNLGSAKPHKIYVTHQPCDNCLEAIHNAGISEIHIVESFMKFDAGKLRYSLVPPSAIEGLAEVLTYGAKKYKPNNWQKVEDTDRYVDALYRHLEAWRNGEKLDEESGLSHLKHALTNVAFLIHFEDHISDTDDNN